MKHPFDTSTDDLFGVAPRRGRPPVGTRPMTGAERQAAYRRRLTEAAQSVPVLEASRVTLIARLSQALADYEALVTAGFGRFDQAALTQALNGAWAEADACWRELERRFGHVDAL